MSCKEKVNIIAIDGPAGSGKSTVSRLTAERLKYLYVDTGAMYRAITLKVMRRGIDFSDIKGIVEIASKTEIRLKIDKNQGFTVLLDGEDVSKSIREMAVSENIKYVASIRNVRSALVSIQREMVKGQYGAVMEGRDIGTVVFPDAAVKVYLDATFDERVARRLKELRCKAKDITKEDVEKDLKLRDHSDKTRENGPLKKADDAFVLDTTGLSIEDVVERIVDYASEKR